MPETEDSPIMRRLLMVTSECRDAFTEAAYVVTSPRLSALFVRRAEHQSRIAAFLSEHEAFGSVATVRTRHAPSASAASVWRARAGAPLRRDPFALLGACVRVLESSILEYARAFRPAMPLDQRLSLERHHDRMRWSRDELLALRQSYKPSRLAQARREQISQARMLGEEIWFGTPANAGNGELWVTPTRPPTGGQHHDSELERAV